MKQQARSDNIRLLLVDDQAIIRDGLRSLLDATEDVEVVGEAANGLEAIEQALALQPHVVLMDVRMPHLDGVAATREIKRQLPQITILILTTFDDDEYIIRAMTDGAAGYLLKDTRADQLIAAIRDALAGNIILPGRIAAKITSRLQNVPPPTPIESEDFSPREKDIIAQLLQGKNNREIASDLYLSVGTVKNYLSQIYLKLGVSDRAQAVLKLRSKNFQAP